AAQAGQGSERQSGGIGRANLRRRIAYQRRSRLPLDAAGIRPAHLGEPDQHPRRRLRWRLEGALRVLARDTVHAARRLALSGRCRGAAPAAYRVALLLAIGLHASTLRAQDGMGLPIAAVHIESDAWVDEDGLRALLPLQPGTVLTAEQLA